MTVSLQVKHLTCYSHTSQKTDKVHITDKKTVFFNSDL